MCAPKIKEQREKRKTKRKTPRSRKKDLLWERGERKSLDNCAVGPEGISSDWKRRVDGSRRERKRGEDREREGKEKGWRGRGDGR